MSKKQLALIKEKLLAQKERLEQNMSRAQARLADTALLQEQSTEEGELVLGYEERAIRLQLARNTEEQLCQVCEALERMELGTYGICKHTHKQIPVERLLAYPMCDSLVETLGSGYN